MSAWIIESKTGTTLADLYNRPVSQSDAAENYAAKNLSHDEEKSTADEDTSSIKHWKEARRDTAKKRLPPK